ncbi:MAG: hypothetical protein WBM44_27090, partial [Waterburya sp.]
GCSQNLEVVEEFGLTSSLIKDSSSKIISDIYDSCIRRERHEINIDKLRQDQFDSLPSDQSGQQNFTIVSEKSNFEPVRLQKKCKDAQNKSEIFDSLNTVIIDYVAVLGRLASRNTVSFNQNLALIETSINNNFITKIAEESQDEFQVNVASIVGVANSLINLVADQQREDSLKPIIICTNDYLKNYINDFNNLISDYYISGLLQEEEEALEREYEMLFNRQKLPEAALQENFATNMLIIDNNQNAAKTYQKILQRTSVAHQSLANIFASNIGKEKDLLCKSYFDSENSNYIIFTENPNTETNKKQMKQAEKILEKYLTDIKILETKLYK